MLQLIRDAEKNNRGILTALFQIYISLTSNDERQIKSMEICRLLSISKYYYGIPLEKLSKTTKNFKPI
jgi:hypothetical protein